MEKSVLPIIDQPPIDTLLNGRVSLMQPANGYRAAIDPVLLAAACPATKDELVLEGGCGVGAAALSLIARTKCRVAGLELQSDLVKLAQGNAELNGATDHFMPIPGSILSPPAEIKQLRFDHAIVNPPYLAQEVTETAKSLSNNEGDAKLSDWIDFAVKRVKHGGSIVFIHRADRLDEILYLLSEKVGAIVILPLWRKAGDEARRIIVGGIKGRKTKLRLLPGMDLHNSDGSFTSRAEDILRGGQALTLWP